MRKRAILLSTILCILFACGEQTPTFTLEGTYGNGNDTIYMFGTDVRHNYIDTIYTDEYGEFAYKLETDTIIPLAMILPDGNMLPVYAQPDITAALSLEENRWHIIGGPTQALYDSISKRLEAEPELSRRYEAIDSFIEKHPYSDINIHLLQRYFVEVGNPKSSLIKSRIELMGGTLQDNDYISKIKKLSNNKILNIVNKAFPEYIFTTATNDTVNRSTYMDKYLLVTFWASWDSASISHLSKFKDADKKIDSKYFGKLNISLDHDTASWRQSIENNIITGDNVCDLKMWENSVVKEFTIENLPFSILVNPYMRVHSFNPDPDTFIHTVDSLIEKYKAKEKAKREREAIKIKEVSKKEEQKKKEAELRKRGIYKQDDNQRVNNKIIK